MSICSSSLYLLSARILIAYHYQGPRGVGAGNQRFPARQAPHHLSFIPSQFLTFRSPRLFIFPCLYPALSSVPCPLFLSRLLSDFPHIKRGFIAFCEDSPATYHRADEPRTVCGCCHFTSAGILAESDQSATSSTKETKQPGPGEMAQWLLSQRS